MSLKLFGSTRSPFVRKALVAAIETGQRDDLEVIEGDPHGIDPDLRAANPIAKIPALVTEDGVGLPESDLICLYLDERAGGGALIPRESPARWETLARQAVADGFMEAAVKRRDEALRPDGERSAAEIKKLSDRMARCMDVLEADVAALTNLADIGTIAAAVACSYADFRYPDWDWRRDRPGLAAFYAEYSQRPSMRATVLKAP